MIRTRSAGLFLTSMAMMMLGACTQLPSASYTAGLRAAVTEAREAGDLVLIDHASIKERAERVRDLGESSPRIPVFDPKDIRSSLDANRETLARRRAWAALERYTVALAVAQRNEGTGLADETGALLSSINALGGSVLPPGVSEVVGIVADKVDKELQARRFERAVLEAKPLMDEIVQMLIGDTVDYYDVRRVLHNRAADALRDPNGERINRFNEVAGLVAFSYDPDAREPARGSYDDLVRRLNAALLELGALEDNLPHADGVPVPGEDAYDQRVAETLTQIVLETESAAQEHRALVGKLETYHETLTAYVVMLHEVSAAHRALHAAVTTARPAIPDLSALLDAAITVRTALRSGG